MSASVTFSLAPIAAGFRFTNPPAATADAAALLRNALRFRTPPAYHACNAGAPIRSQCELLATFDPGQPPLVNLGDTGKGADVLTVLLDVAGESQLHRGDQPHGLRQCLMPFGEFLQPLVDGHGFSVARRQTRDCSLAPIAAGLRF